MLKMEGGMSADMGGVVLLDGKGKKWRVPVGEGLVRVEGVGRVHTDHLNRMIGRSLEIGGKMYAVQQPSLRDVVETLRRKAQIIGPKDGAYIVFNCGIHAGDVVVEGGAGSGAMTIMMAHAVAPSGRILSYEARSDFLQVAQENVHRAGLAGMVDFRLGRIEDGIEAQDAKAIVLDLPEPWEAIPVAQEALQVGGHFASYSPTMEQTRETVLSLRSHGFIDVWSVELFERRLEVGRGTRPSFRMLGHTGYLTFARAARGA